MAGQQENTIIDVFPGLAVDVGIECLARLPLGLHPLARCVCRSWQRALAPAVDLEHMGLALQRRCKLHHLRETWLCVCNYSRLFPCASSLWHLIDPLLCKCYAIPSPPFPVKEYGVVLGEQQHPYRSRVHVNVVGGGGWGNLMVFRDVGTYGESCKLSRDEAPLFFNVITRKWSACPAMCVKERWIGACAELDGDVYVAGGRVTGDQHSAAVDFDKTAERFKASMQTWESLPAMAKPKGVDFSQGFSCDECFYAAGDFGYEQFHSGEIYDPKVSAWTSFDTPITRIWGRNPQYHSGTVGFAVVAGLDLYAVDKSCTRFFVFSKQEKVWHRQPHDESSLWQSAQPSKFFRHAIVGLVGVEDQLWLLVPDHCRQSMEPDLHYPIKFKLKFVVCDVPQSHCSMPMRFKQLPYSIPIHLTSSFAYTTVTF